MLSAYIHDVGRAWQPAHLYCMFSFRTSDSRASFAVLPAQDTTPTTVQENVATIRRRHKKVTRDRQRNQNVPLPDGRTLEVDHLLPAVEFLPLLSFSDNE